MATIGCDDNGRKRILFFGADNKRKTIRLGRCDKSTAMSVKVHIERLAAATLTGMPLCDDTNKWLNSIDDGFYRKLVAVGLAVPRDSFTLGTWVQKFLDSRSGLKPRSLLKLQQTTDRLLAFFHSSTPLRKITPQQAADWRHWLTTGGKAPITREDFSALSDATVKIHSGNAKTIFREAHKRKLVNENVFIDLGSGSTATKNERYVTPEEADRIVNACDYLPLKVLFALARYAGLRVSSESHRLTWADVNWDKAELTVWSPKTERHPGHEKRIVPIAPKLMNILMESFEKANAGDVTIVSLPVGGWMGERMKRLLKKAEVEQWADLWQTLRSSCEIQWANEGYPQYAVSMWIGHSITVSGKHYANRIPDVLVDRLTGRQQQAAQNPAQNPKELGENTGNPTEAKDSKAPENIEESVLMLQPSKGFEPLT